MEPGRRKCVMGLIGGIGSGKSRVADELARHGARVIRADQLGHQALQQPQVKAKLAQLWGEGVFSAAGEVDRRSVADIVFKDPAERKALEELVFPYIERGMDERIVEAQHDPTVSCIVLDAAILLEAGWDRRCDCIVYVHAPRQQRLERLARQRCWNEKEVRQRSLAQLPLTEKVTRAHVVIDNSSSLAELTRQIDCLLAGPELSLAAL